MKKFALIVFAALLFTACQKDIKEQTPAPLMKSEPASETNTATRPMKIKVSSTVNPASPTLTCTLPGVPFAILNSGYYLHGTATHMGNINPASSMGQDGSCHLSGTTFVLSTTTGGQIVAADGDMITYTGNDEIDLNNIIFNGGTTAAITGLWTITGGTGKFAGATGSFTISGLVDVTTTGGPTFSITGEGSITY